MQEEFFSRDIFASMEEVKDVHGFWNFTENDLLDGLFSEEWYNEGATISERYIVDDLGRYTLF